MANRSRLVPLIAALLLTGACDSASRSDTPNPPAQPPAKAQPAIAKPAAGAAPVAPAPGRMPLARILTIVKADTPGEVIEVDYDDDDHKYEITVLTPVGRSRELEIDARTGAILDREED